jgi:hypothetical protein
MKRVNKSQEVAARLFTQYQPLTQRMASKFATTYGMDYHQLLEEANGILSVNACLWNSDTASEFDATKSCEMSWIYRGLYWGLMDFCTRKRDKARSFSSLRPEENPIDAPAKTSRMSTLRQNLGEDARILVETILSAPVEIADDIQTSTRGRARKALRSYFTQRGWDTDRIERAWNEVTTCLA